MKPRNYCINIAFTVLTICLLAACGPQPETAPAPQAIARSPAVATTTLPKNTGTPAMRESFNPAGCKSGSQDYVYWAAHDQVFKFRYDPTQPIYSRLGIQGEGAMNEADWAEVLPAPDPAEPHGCYGNPLRAVAVPYMDQFGKALYRTLTGYEVPGYLYQNGYSSVREYLRDSSSNEGSGKLFQNGRDCVRRNSGIVDCVIDQRVDRKSVSASRMLKIEGAQVFPASLAIQDIYIHIMGGPFDVSGPNRRLMYTLTGELDLFNAVRIKDQFDVYLEDIDMLVPYYRGMIGYLADAHIPDYQWPTVKTNK